MSEQVHRQRQTTTQTVGEVSTHPAASAHPQGTGAGLDDLLDSIDAVLETNAEEYVRSFVQKGGQ